MLMLTGWGYTWLLVSAVLMSADRLHGAHLAADGAYLAFVVAVGTGLLGAVRLWARAQVHRRLLLAERAMSAVSSEAGGVRP